MFHAILMTVHKYPEQVFEIVRLLDAPNHYFFIHVDKKSYKNMMASTELQMLSKKDNCTVFSSVSVNWGGYSQILATLELMKETLKSTFYFSFYHFISGQDYPLVDNKTFDAFFKENKNNSFVGIDNCSYNDRYELFHLNDIVNVASFPYNKIEGLLSMIQRNINKILKLRNKIGLKIYKGSNWWSINDKMFNLIISFLKENKFYIRIFRYTSCCDEIFFHTIMFNSKLKDNIVTNNLLYVDWHPKHKNDSLPRILDESDYECILKSNSMFCRKIDPIVSKTLKFRILERINNM